MIKDENEWLKVLLERMQGDIANIKADIHELNKAKFKFDGAILVVSSLLSISITLCVKWLIS
jgi:hypothetical protein